MNNLTKKRIAAEIMDLEKNPLKDYDVYQDEKNILVIYSLFKGPIKTYYEGGYYILKIELANDYPKSPPNYYMFTPSGRFDILKKICITNSGYHKDLWSPKWNIKNMMESFVSIMADDTTNGISHIFLAPDVRRRMATDSFSYNVTKNGDLLKKFKRFPLIIDGVIKRMRTEKEVIGLQENKKTNSLIKKSIENNTLNSDTKNIENKVSDNSKINVTDNKVLDNKKTETIDNKINVTNNKVLDNKTETNKVLDNKKETDKALDDKKESIEKINVTDKVLNENTKIIEISGKRTIKQDDIENMIDLYKKIDKKLKLSTIKINNDRKKFDTLFIN